MKRYRLKKWVKVVLNLLLISGVITIFYLAFRVTPEDIEKINYCEAQGNSRQSCINGYFGY